ncbi:MAG: homocysteine S-methyltransferase family protein [Elusimicrobia bacterium]|nr:homocysteine S-methyltransferase family protein [Elusimicrobiota bacterium]
MTSEEINKIFAERIPVFDGAMGSYLQGFGLKEADFAGHEGLNEILSVSRPEIIAKVHEDYLAAGADFIETNTFGANAAVLAEYGLASRVREFNLASARLARAAADKYSGTGRPRYVAASVGPTNKALFVTGGLGFDDLRAVYLEQVAALLDGGVDLLLLETAHDVLNLKAGLAAVRLAFEKAGRELPVMVSATMDKRNKMLSGHDAEAFYAAVEHFPLAALGFNCSTGPEDLGLRLERLAGRAQYPVLAMPNAGMPDEKGRYRQTPPTFSSVMADYSKKGLLNAVGGCCGTTPAHIKALAGAVAGIKPRAPRAGPPWVVSGIEPLFFDEIEPPAMVGERNNSIGSRKFRDMVAAGDWDGAVALAKAQAAAGAHILDVCLANPERNELEDVKTFMPRLARAVRLPIMTDTTDIAVMEEVLKTVPGKVLLNSVNFEFGPEKPRAAAGLAGTYGAKLVFGCIDADKEHGLPLDAERKVAIARRAYAFLTGECGLKAGDIIFDTLVFPVAVGGGHAKTAYETIKAIETIKKEFPGVKTMLGVSNVSFGLPPTSREVLNSVFLHHAVKAGLDLAIVNIEKLKRFASISAEERELAEDLVFARKPDAAQAFAARYRDAKKASSAPAAPDAAPADKLRLAVLNGLKAGIEEAVAALLLKHSPLEIINGPVMLAMAEVGGQFAAGDLIVTEVLQSAEAAKVAVNALEPALKAQKAPKRGRVLLATVKGDVHDIGKNLVGIIFESNGFEVEDLGVKAAPEEITAAAVKSKPDFIGLSGLLVRSCEQMTIAARELEKAGVKAPLLVGGAALTEKFTDANIAPNYGGPVFYARDAMEGLNYALERVSGKLREEKHGAPAVVRERAAAGPAAALPPPVPAGPNGESSLPLAIPAGPKGESSLPLAIPAYPNGESSLPLASFSPPDIPVPADLERHFTGDQPLAELFEHLDEGLFNLRFLKLKKTQEEKSREAKELLAGIKDEILKKGLIKARGVYRFFPVNGSGNELHFYDGGGRKLASFDFPRQPGGERLCLSDFAAPASEGRKDYAALLAVTCGEGVLELARREREAGNYVRSYLVEALALTLAEAFADVLHYRIRRDWGIAEENPAKPLLRSRYRGKRYSFGYPVCPDLANQKVLFDLLKPERDAGLRLTDGFMMDPEASVSAIVFHNPKAVYFNV